MLGALDMLMKSEFNNAGDLLGIDGISPELMGYLGRLDPVSKAKTMAKLTKKQIPSVGSRAEFEKFFSELPQHIKEQLLQGKLRLADHILYSIKAVNGSKTIKMFESQDIKEVGLRNLSNGKLPKNMCMLVSGISILQGVAATNGVDDVKSTVFNIIDTKGALTTGEFTLKANKKQIVSDTSMSVFRTGDFHLVPKGFYKLANPRLIQDDVDIDFDIELGTITGLDPTAYLYVGLHGTVTIP